MSLVAAMGAGRRERGRRESSLHYGWPDDQVVISTFSFGNLINHFKNQAL